MNKTTLGAQNIWGNDPRIGYGSALYSLFYTKRLWVIQCLKTISEQTFNDKQNGFVGQVVVDCNVKPIFPGLLLHSCTVQDERTRAW